MDGCIFNPLLQRESHERTYVASFANIAFSVACSDRGIFDLGRTHVYAQILRAAAYLCRRVFHETLGAPGQRTEAEDTENVSNALNH